jgi:hypothetical protein
MTAKLPADLRVQGTFEEQLIDVTLAPDLTMAEKMKAARYLQAVWVTGAYLEQFFGRPAYEYVRRTLPEVLAAHDMKQA